MMNVSRDESKTWAGWRGMRLLLGALAGAALLGVACSDDDEPEPSTCTEPNNGAVAGAADMHCVAADGSAIVQAIGACVSGAEAEESEEEEHEHEEEEEHEPYFGREAHDDDCKYLVSFTNSCVAVNEPVTFTLSLTRLFDDAPGAGTNPAFPEIFLENDLTHISPSNDITARETAPGVYDIGPVVFDAPGRWVVRFHYFENCSDIVADSPHGHAAFYIDVP